MTNSKEFDVVETRVKLSDDVDIGCQGTIVMQYDSDNYEVEFCPYGVYSSFLFALNSSQLKFIDNSKQNTDD